MDRKHTVLAASGVSALLVVGSTAFAFANGIFVSKPVAHIGTYQAINARLVPATRPVTTLGSSSRPMQIISTPRRTASSISAPAFRAAPAPRFVPAVRAAPAPRFVPAVRVAATPIVAHSGPSAVSPAHGEDDHESPDAHESVEGHESDD